MKYVLLLTFSHKKYKDKPGELIIHLNDRMIDTIILDQDIGLKQVTMTTRDRKNVKTTHSYIRPDKIYYYEIEDSELLQEDRENKLTISVKNDNSNYTNGFMTNSSLLSIASIFFLPLDLFNIEKIKKINDRVEQKFWKNYFTHEYWDSKTDHPSPETTAMKKFYKYENDIYDKNRGNDPTMNKERYFWHKHYLQNNGSWPCVVHPLDYTYNSENDNKEIPNYSEGWPIGGSFEFSLPITKKHRMYSIRQKNYKGPFFPGHRLYETMIEMFKGSPDCTIINTSSVVCEHFFDFQENTIN